MVNYTTNYELKKPLVTEKYSVDDQNGNMDIIDKELNKGATERAELAQFKESKGQANGLASLDGGGKVPSGQLPDMNYISTNQKGVVNGVATLDGSGNVPRSMLGNVPEGAKIVSGSYAGNDSYDSRTIYIGFTPKFIYVVSQGDPISSGAGLGIEGSSKNGVCKYDYNNSAMLLGGKPRINFPVITTNGFQVQETQYSSEQGINEYNVTYRYVAIG